MARAEKTVVLNVRVTERQAAWIRKRAEERHSGNLSEAVREAVTDAWLLEAARADYRRLRDEHGFRLPLPGREPGALYLALALPIHGAIWEHGDEEL